VRTLHHYDRSPDLPERVSREWQELIGDVERAVSDEPAEEKTQSLAARWKTLVEGFTGGDPDITASVGCIWQDRDNWPEDMNRRAPVIRPEA
jgi:hypothetical protein